MNGHCDFHTYERAVDVCGLCYADICTSCALQLKGRKDPVCKDCALVVSGVRGSAKPEVRGDRRTVKDRRAAYAEAGTGGQFFEFFDTTGSKLMSPVNPVAEPKGATRAQEDPSGSSPANSVSTEAAPAGQPVSDPDSDGDAGNPSTAGRGNGGLRGFLGRIRSDDDEQTLDSGIDFDYLGEIIGEVDRSIDPDDQSRDDDAITQLTDIRRRSRADAAGVMLSRELGTEPEGLPGSADGDIGDTSVDTNPGRSPFDEVFAIGEDSQGWVTDDEPPGIESNTTDSDDLPYRTDPTRPTDPSTVDGDSATDDQPLFGGFHDSATVENDRVVGDEIYDPAPTATVTTAERTRAADPTEDERQHSSGLDGERRRPLTMIQSETATAEDDSTSLSDQTRMPSSIQDLLTADSRQSDNLPALDNPFRKVTIPGALDSKLPDFTSDPFEDVGPSSVSETTVPPPPSHRIPDGAAPPPVRWPEAGGNRPDQDDVSSAPFTPVSEFLDVPRSAPVTVIDGSIDSPRPEPAADPDQLSEPYDFPEQGIPAYDPSTATTLADNASDHGNDRAEVEPLQVENPSAIDPEAEADVDPGFPVVSETESVHHWEADSRSDINFEPVPPVDHEPVPPTDFEPIAPTDFEPVPPVDHEPADTNNVSAPPGPMLHTNDRSIDTRWERPDDDHWSTDFDPLEPVDNPADTDHRFETANGVDASDGVDTTRHLETSEHRQGSEDAETFDGFETHETEGNDHEGGVDESEQNTDTFEPIDNFDTVRSAESVESFESFTFGGDQQPSADDHQPDSISPLSSDPDLPVTEGSNDDSYDDDSTSVNEDPDLEGSTLDEQRADVDARGSWIPPALRGVASDAADAGRELPRRRG